MIQELLGGRISDRISSSSEPWRTDKCERLDCPLCTQELEEGEKVKRNNCWSRSATYQLTCTSCKAAGKRTTYTGETTNLYRRGKQHFTGLEKRTRKSALYLHMEEEHPNIEPKRSNFKLEVTGYQRTALGRQAEEGAIILQELKDLEKRNLAPARRGEGEGGGGQILNSRGEFHQPLGGIKTRTSFL